MRLNEDIDDAILLNDRLTGPKVFPSIPRYRMSRFNVVVRGTSVPEVERKCFLVADYLASEHEQQLGGILFKSMDVLNDPILFPISQGDYVEALVRVETYFVITDFGDYVNP